MAFTTAPILTHFQPGAQLTVKTNTLDYVIASILSITGLDDKIRPIAFYSHTLTMPELNYDTHDKELLAIFEAFKSWRCHAPNVFGTVDMEKVSR